MDDPRIAALVANYTPEGKAGAAPIGFGDRFIFYVGKDDCHSILKLLIGQETNMLKGNAFGYDDDELNDEIMNLIQSTTVHVQWTLDKSQAGGVHERKIVEADQQALGGNFSNSFAIGQSATHQISHTKGGVFVGQGICFEGSMNWSASGEGTGIEVGSVDQPTGWKAQNNTLMISANALDVLRFAAELDKEHQIALQQMMKAQAKEAADATSTTA